MKTTLHALAALATLAGMIGAGACECYPMVLVSMAGMIWVTGLAMSHKADQMAQARATKR